MAGAFTNQPRSTPITNQQQANQLGKGDFSSFNNQGMQQPGTGGGMGPNGDIHSLGGGMAHTTFYAVVASGLPIIRNPKTGEPYPPGHIPTIQDPNTWEQWRPGDSWKEVMGLADAQLAEDLRMAQETVFRPAEEAAAELVGGFKRDLGNASKKWATGAAEKIYGKDNKTLKDIQQRGAETTNQAIKQAPKIAQEAIRQAPQVAQKVGQAASQTFGGASQFGASTFVGGGTSTRPTQGGGTSTRPPQGEMRSALTSVAGDRTTFTSGARRN